MWAMAQQRTTEQEPSTGFARDLQTYKPKKSKDNNQQTGVNSLGSGIGQEIAKEKKKSSYVVDFKKPPAWLIAQRLGQAKTCGTPAMDVSTCRQIRIDAFAQEKRQGKGRQVIYSRVVPNTRKKNKSKLR